MQQYFIDEQIELNQKIAMNDNQSHHIKNVMRMKENTIVKVVDVDHQGFLGKIIYEDKQVYVLPYEAMANNDDGQVTLILAQALIKKDKWDFLLQKTSELGVDEIIPFECKRCVVKSKDEKSGKKLQRWQTILKEASEQCKRNTIPIIQEVCDFKALSHMEADLKIIAYEDASASSEHLIDVLEANQDVKSICMVVGCEGGFDLEEVKYLQQHGFVRVSLGNRILRAETAAMSLVNTIGFYYDMIKRKKD